jgi:hypothetical protein
MGMRDSRDGRGGRREGKDRINAETMKGMEEGKDRINSIYKMEG